MKEKKHFISIIIALTLIALLLGSMLPGCAKPKEEEIGTIKMGIITPLSGFAAAWGIPHLQSFELAFDIINEEGGVVVDGKRYYFEAVGYDNKLSADDTVTVTNKLIYEDGVRYVSILDLIAPVRDLCRKEGILQINLAWQYESMNPNYPLMFHYLQHAHQCAAVIWPWIADNYPDVKTVVGIGPDYSTGYLCQEVSKRACEYLGMEVPEVFFFEPAAQDFSALLIKALEHNPDFIQTGGSPAAQAALIVKQARELGYKGLIGDIGNGSKGEPGMIEIAGAENMAGYIAWGLKEEKDYTAAMLDWKTRSLEKYGEPFNATTIDWSMGAWTLADGIKAANSLEPTEIAAALQAPDFQGENLWGAYSYGGEELYGIGNEMLAPIVFFQWGEDGKPHNIVKAYPEQYMKGAVDMGLDGLWK